MESLCSNKDVPVHIIIAYLFLTLCSNECVSGPSRVSEHDGVPSFDIISERDHADGLPDAKTDTRGDTTVEALDTVLFVDVRQCVQDRQLFGTTCRASSF